MSLPAILGTTLHGIPLPPYLSVDARTAEHWRPIVGAFSSRAQQWRSDPEGSARAFTIGIAWQGNRGNTIDRWRCFLFGVLHLAAIDKVRLISLQFGDGAEQLGELQGRFSVAELRQDNDGEDPAHSWIPRPDQPYRPGYRPRVSRRAPGRRLGLSSLGAAVDRRRLALDARTC